MKCLRHNTGRNVIRQNVSVCLVAHAASADEIKMDSTIGVKSAIDELSSSS
jgi:hypothetical protein